LRFDSGRDLEYDHGREMREDAGARKRERRYNPAPLQVTVENRAMLSTRAAEAG